MNLYPALRARMGTWDYFVVKLTMREVSEHVKFASDIHQDHTLNEAIQRTLSESRANKEIVGYLQRQDHRFFSSLVIAALEGDPKWYPIMIADNPQFAIFKDDERLNSTFGVLKFDGTQKYYALDGQHRLSAIKTLLDTSGEAWRDAPDGFSDEEISVILVHPRDDERDETFMLRYRRLFGNLNRHAKPTSHFTNIVMDEDDTFAILTRRLITEHQFFMSPGRRHRESTRIKMQKGKNVRRGSTAFTSLEQLYALNRHFLTSRTREQEGWAKRDFLTFRLDDDKLDELFNELVDTWEAVIQVLPDLKHPPEQMRCHDREGLDEDTANPKCTHNGKCDDSALFWPITQDLVARLVRDLLDSRDGGRVARLTPLAKLQFSLHRPPWRHLFLIPNVGSDGANAPRGGTWKIRSEDRKDVIAVLHRILLWQLGLVSLTSEEEADLRADWKQYLYPQWGDTHSDRMRRQQLWAQISADRTL